MQAVTPRAVAHALQSLRAALDRSSRTRLEPCGQAALWDERTAGRALHRLRVGRRLVVRHIFPLLIPAVLSWPTHRLSLTRCGGHKVTVPSPGGLGYAGAPSDRLNKLGEVDKGRLAQACEACSYASGHGQSLAKVA